LISFAIIIGILIGGTNSNKINSKEVTTMALFLMIGLVTVGVMLYAGVMLYSLKRESDQIFS